MKIKSLILFSSICLTILLVGCKEGAEYNDVIYIAGAEVDSKENLVMDVAPDSTFISVVASDRVKATTRVYLTVKPELVEEYNRKFHTNYKFPPLLQNFSIVSQDKNANPSSNPLVAEVVIPAGGSASGRIKLTVESFEQFDDTAIYCIPVSITHSNQNLEILESSATKFVVLGRTIYTNALSRSGSNIWFGPEFHLKGGDDLKAVSGVTYEARIRMNGWGLSGWEYISTIMGMEENFVLRFGDGNAMGAAGDVIKPDQMQVAKGGDKVMTSHHFITGVWYNVAAVFNGNAGTYTLYVNGQKDGELSGVSHSTLDMTFYQPGDPNKNRFAIGHSEHDRYFNGAISEVRVWTRALTNNEIINNMCAVDPASSGLLAYWRFNEDSYRSDLTNKDGDVKSGFRDETPNGWHAYPNGAYGALSYLNLKCPE